MVLEIPNEVWQAFQASVADLQNEYKAHTKPSAEKPKTFAELSNLENAAASIQKSLVFVGEAPGYFKDSALIGLLTACVRQARQQLTASKGN
jgi:hypothetical protein